MRMRLTLIAAAAAVPMLIAAVSSADAACFRKCTKINASGSCTAYSDSCDPVPESAGKNLKALRDGMSCRTQGLVCDWATGCKAVCGAPKMAKKK